MKKAIVMACLSINPFIKKLKPFPLIEEQAKKEKICLFKPKKQRITKAQYFELLNLEEKTKIALEFYKKHRELLEEIGETYKISPTIIASVVAIETAGGKFLGNYRLIDVIVSRFIFSSSRLWKNEIRALEELLENGFNPFIPSSYYGAFGIPQFLPSSFLKYGVDYDKNGEVDIFSLQDALASLANYLSKHGGDKNMDKALHAYNPSEWYVEAVLKVNDNLYNMIKSEETLKSPHHKAKIK